MINGKRIVVVLPAYNAEKTLAATVAELPDLVDIRILVDDHSSDHTVEIAERLGLQFFLHDDNYGYGRNQQTCYREALVAGADVVIMVHPDYQYTPLLVTAMASMVAYDVYDVVRGSRIIGGQALRGGMPFYKYVANRLPTAFENLFRGSSYLNTTLVPEPSAAKPCRASARKFGRFRVDNQVLAQAKLWFRIGEVSCPTKYFEEAFHQLPTKCDPLPGVLNHFAVCAKNGVWQLPDFQQKRQEADGYCAAGAQNLRPAGTELQGVARRIAGAAVPTCAGPVTRGIPGPEARRSGLQSPPQ
jgi:hypothetical protein